MIVGSVALHHHHGPPPRPSTSPVPNLFNLNGAAAAGNNHTTRGGPPARAATGSKHGAAAAGAAAQQQQQAAAVRLRPLPPATQRGSATLLGGSGVGPFGSLMMIEGKTTGEERERSAVDKREAAAASADASPAAFGPAAGAPNGSRAGRSTPSGGEDEAKLLKQRLRKLEADLKKSQETCKKRGNEISELQSAADQLRVRLTSSDAALERAQRDMTESASNSTAALGELKGENIRLQRELDAARAEARISMEQSQRAAASQLGAAARAQSELEASLKAELAQANATAAREKQRADALQMQLSAAQRDLQAAKERAEAELAARQQAEAVNIARMAQLEREADEARNELAAWRERIAQVDSFVLEICQPQFAVVKDEGLAPLSPEARESANGPNGGPAGFVLVPLHLLLQGYALLPGEKKKSIADKYEQSKGGDGKKANAGALNASISSRTSW